MRKLFWISTAYFSEGLAFALLSVACTVFYQNLGFSNERITFFTSLFLLPWSLKPFWAPLLELWFTKKQWMVRVQLLESVLLLLVAASLFYAHFFLISFILLLSLAILGASFDTVTDGFYIYHLSLRDQHKFLGFRSLFYQSARFFVQGILLMAVGYCMHFTSILFAWKIFFLCLAFLTFMLMLWHQYCLRDKEKLKKVSLSKIRHTFFYAYKNFLKIPHVGWLILFLMLLNAGDGQLIKIVPLFLLDPNTFHLNTEQVGFIYGTLVGIAMLLGVFVGGWLLNKFSLKRTLWLTTFSMAISSACYIFLSILHIKTFWLISLLVTIPQFCFGAANSAGIGLLLKKVSLVSYKTTCYAFGAAILNLSYVFFGAGSGYIQHYLGYTHFFILVFVLECGVCALVSTLHLRDD